MRVALVVFVALRSLTIVTESAREVCCCYGYSPTRNVLIATFLFFVSKHSENLVNLIVKR